MEQEGGGGGAPAALVGVADAGLWWQLVNIEEHDCAPASIRRDASSGEKMRALAPGKPKAHLTLRFRNMEGESLAVCLPGCFSFFFRLPQHLGVRFTQRHADDLMKTCFGKSSSAYGATLEYRTPLVGYEPHPRNSDSSAYLKPHRVPHVRIRFANRESMRRSFYRYRTKDGTRSMNMEEKKNKLMAKWGVPFHKRKFCSRKAFSAHNMLDSKRMFFNDLLDRFSLQDNPPSYFCWYQLLGLKELPKEKGFNSAQHNAYANDASFILGVETRDEMAPLTVLSFDIEQYAPKIDGKRPFPAACASKCQVTHIGVHIRRGEHDFENVCLCLGKNQLTDANRDTVPGLKLRCYKNEFYLLTAFWDLLRAKDADFVTGFNIISYDLMVVFLRSYMFHLCAREQYRQLSNVQRTAAQKLRIWQKYMKDDELTLGEKAIKTKSLFHIQTNDFKEKGRVPPKFFALGRTGWGFTMQDYLYFRNCAGDSDTANFLYVGQTLARQVKYQETLFQASATGSIKQRYFDEETTGWTTYCCFHHLKKTSAKLKSFSLKACAKHFCGEEDAEKLKIDLPYETLFQIMEGTDPVRKGEAAVYCARDATVPVDILLAKQAFLDITMFSQLQSYPTRLIAFCGQQKRIISKLEERCHHQHFVMNEFHIEDDLTQKYQGATVVDGQPRYFEDPVATLDFASLYPSIMRDNNICFSTLVMDDKDLRPQTRPKTIESDLGSNRFCQSFEGVLPKLLRDLLRKRGEVKKQMKQEQDGGKFKILNMRQLSVKVAANSVYGFPGAKGRMTCRALPASVTAVGRALIAQTKAECERLGYEVVYGDTDSVMVHMPGCNVSQAWEKTLELEEHFPKIFGKIIILEAEKVYHPYLLFGKKRYIGRKFENPRDPTDFKIDAKGVEMVRTDAPILIQSLQKQLVSRIMPSDLAEDISIAGTRRAVLGVVKDWCEKIIRDEVPLAHYELSKTVKSGYKAGLPEQVLVMNRRNQRIECGLQQAEKYQVGSRPRYVVTYCQNKKIAMRERVEDPDWLKEHPECAKVDRLYYFDRGVRAVEKFLQFHVPEQALFKIARGEIQRSLEGNKSVTGYFGKISGGHKPSSRLQACADRLASAQPLSQDTHMPKKVFKQRVLGFAGSKRQAPLKKAPAQKKKKKVPKTRSVVSFFTKK